MWNYYGTSIMKIITDSAKQTCGVLKVRKGKKQTLRWNQKTKENGK